MNLLHGRYTDARVYASIADDGAIRQIQAMIDSPFAEGSKVAIMPDTHAGAGCTIGTTMTLNGKVVPDIVGVDIGCGMLTVELENNFDLGYLDAVIHEKIPAGMNVHESPLVPIDLTVLKCYPKLKNVQWLNNSLGTLGGGNHFIEIDEDSDGKRYLVIHTGSRNLGKQVAEIYQEIANDKAKGIFDLQAKKDSFIAEMKAQGREKEIQEGLKALYEEYTQLKAKESDAPAYLEGQDYFDYLHDMQICQEFAKKNRYLIATIIVKSLFGTWVEKLNHFETIHNYIDIEHGILRKGAVSARKDEILLIPMNMRDGSLICRGKGNADWNYSAPHGAGRILSRAAARQTLSMEEYTKSMEGIYSTCINETTIDESPMSYKPMDVIQEDIKDTVEVIKTIHPIYNFKSGE